MYQLKNKKILITAGSVWVPIDKVRIITNVFKGTLGLLIAKEAVKRGAKVTLLLGPGISDIPGRQSKNLKVIRFKFFNELFTLMKKEISPRQYDVIVHSAAVADYMPISSRAGKIKSRKKNLVIKLKPTIKIIDQIKKWHPQIFLVKFKLETDLTKKELIEKSYKSMIDSNADLMVANDFESIKDKYHKAFIIDPRKNITSCSQKEEISRKLLNIIFKNERRKH